MYHFFEDVQSNPDMGVPTLSTIIDICARLNDTTRVALLSNDVFAHLFDRLDSDRKHSDVFGPWFWAGRVQVRPLSTFAVFRYVECRGEVLQ
jgi:hypothetical protein